MKAKHLITGILTLILLVSLAGCGKKDVATKTDSPEESVSRPEASGTQEMDSGKGDGKEEEAAYEEQEEFFVVKIVDHGDGNEIDISDREWVGGPFTVEGSVDIYSTYGTKCGYTKPNITVDGVNRLGDGKWLWVPFQETSYLVKAEDLGKFVAKTEPDSNGQTANGGAQAGNTGQGSDTAQAGSRNTGDIAQAGDNGAAQAPAATPSWTEPVAPVESAPGLPKFSTDPAPAPTPVPTPAEPAPTPVTTYTEAEAIAIYEGALRDAGMRKPEEVNPPELLAEFGPTDGMGWGIVRVSLNDPYTVAAGSVAGARANGYNLYYIENQGSSDGYVHLKVYRGTQ